jgi:hypothetical protein
MTQKDLKVVNGKIRFTLSKDEDTSLYNDVNNWPLFAFPDHALAKSEDKKVLLVWNSC